MILLDADVILIDHKYTWDRRHAITHDALDRIRSDGHPCGMVAHAVWEVVGVLSYGTPTAAIPRIPDSLRAKYGIVILPDPAVETGFAGCTYQDVLARMATKMNLGDAVQAVQIDQHAPRDSTFLTWNVKDFRGRVSVPVLTPEEWLNQQPPAGPTP